MQPTSPPEAWIVTPEMEGVFYTDQAVELAGFISDVEDVPDDLEASWWIQRESDGAEWEVPLYRDSDGQVLGYADLERGRHRIELRVTDLTAKEDIAGVL